MRIRWIGLLFICAICSSKSYCQESCDIIAPKANESIVRELEYYPSQALKINHLVPSISPILITDDLYAQAIDAQAVTPLAKPEQLTQQHKPTSKDAATNIEIDAQAQIVQPEHSILQEQYMYFPLLSESEEQQLDVDISSETCPKADYLYTKLGIGIVHYGKYKDEELAYYPVSPVTNEFFHFGIGYKSDEALRVEALLNFLNINYKAYDESLNGRVQQKVSSFAAMLNFYYDFRSPPQIHERHLTPYFMCGLGVSRHNAKTLEVYYGNKLYPTPGKVTISPSWNVGFGLKYDFNKAFSVDIGYRYFNYGEFDTDTFSEPIKGNQILTSFYFNW